MEAQIEDAALVAEPSVGDNARLAAGASVNLAGKAFSTPVRFVTQVFLARWLGRDAYGLYALGWTLLSMVQTIAPLGVDRGVVRFLPRYWRRDASGVKGVILESHGVAFLGGLILGAATFLAAPWLANSFFQKPSLVLVLRLFALAFPLQSLLIVTTMASRATQSMKYAVLSLEVVQPAANLVLAVGLLVVGWGLVGGVVGGVVSVALAAVVALYYVWRVFPEAFARATPFRSKLRELLVFSLPTYGAGVFALMISRFGRLALGIFRSAAEVGIYQTVGQLPIFFEFVLTTFQQMLAPMIVDLEQQRDRARLESLYRVSTKWSFYISRLNASMAMLMGQVSCGQSGLCNPVIYGDSQLVETAAEQSVRWRSPRDNLRQARPNDTRISPCEEPRHPPADLSDLVTVRMRQAFNQSVQA